MELKLHPITLYLKEPFTISRGSYSERKALIVELSVDGLSGFGEASEHSYYGIETARLIADAEKLRPVVESYRFERPESFWYFLAPQFKGPGFLQCAFDNAAHDLYGKLHGKPCHQLWGFKTSILPKTSYTLSIDSIEKMVTKLQSTQFDIYKIKLGTKDDMGIMRVLRQHTTAALRVDANCAWTANEAIRYSHEMKELGVEFIEQPLKANDWEGMKKLYRESALPLFADEACVREDDEEKCALFFQGINIKLMKCGGLTPALRMLANAMSLGLETMCGCMIESSVGISAIAQLLPLLDYVDMDSTLLLASDPARGASVLDDGSVVLPEGNGLGIELVGG